MIKGVVFDLDGTLVDSGLDFAAMRREMELPEEMAMLEAVGKLEGRRGRRCREILERQEWEGAERAELLPGVGELLGILQAKRVRRAIATRNSREITRATLAKVGVEFELVFTRDDGPVKPDPWSVKEAARLWGVSPVEIVVVGDFRFDVECGKAAGSRTVLLTHPHDPQTYPNGERADLVLRSLTEHARLLTWIESLSGQ